MNLCAETFHTALATTLLLAGCSATSSQAAPETAAERAEVTFLQRMIPHHAQAIAMAQAELPQGVHAEIKTITSNIITSQQPK